MSTDRARAVLNLPDAGPRPSPELMARVEPSFSARAGGLGLGPAPCETLVSEIRRNLSAPARAAPRRLSTDAGLRWPLSHEHAHHVQTWDDLQARLDCHDRKSIPLPCSTCGGRATMA